jgi:hypothetical protein
MAVISWGSPNFAKKKTNSGIVFASQSLTPLLINYTHCRRVVDPRFTYFQYSLNAYSRLNKLKVYWFDGQKQFPVDNDMMI